MMNTNEDHALRVIEETLWSTEATFGPAYKAGWRPGIIVKALRDAGFEIVRSEPSHSDELSAL